MIRRTKGPIMDDKDITKQLREYASEARVAWDDLPKGGDYFVRDMALAAMLDRAAATIDTLYGEVRDLKQRNTRLLSQMQEMEAREQ